MMRKKGSRWWVGWRTSPSPAGEGERSGAKGGDVVISPRAGSAVYGRVVRKYEEDTVNTANEVFDV